MSVQPSIGAVEEVVNLGIPSQPLDTTLRVEWDHWTSGNKLGASFSKYNRGKYEKDTNSGYPENKAEEWRGFSAAYEGNKSKKKDKKKRKNQQDKNMEKEKEKMEELAEPVPQLWTLSDVSLV